MHLSIRRNGRSLGQMARDELGPIGGWAAILGVLSIMLILLAVLCIVVINALAESPWGVFSIAVSYTHLDVYKRQREFDADRTRAGDDDRGRQLGVEDLLLVGDDVLAHLHARDHPGDRAGGDDEVVEACLLYTSRCV